jgi:hypothetical protein
MRFSSFNAASRSPYWYSYRAQRSQRGRARSGAKLGITRSKRARASKRLIKICEGEAERQLTVLVVDRDEEPKVSQYIVDLIPENVQPLLKYPTRDRLFF